MAEDIDEIRIRDNVPVTREPQSDADGDLTHFWVRRIDPCINDRDTDPPPAFLRECDSNRIQLLWNHDVAT